MYQLTALTACAMSGLVHITANIKLPTVDAYGTQDISFLSASLLGHILEDNLKLIGSRVEIDLQSCILKCFKIFFQVILMRKSNLHVISVLVNLHP